MIERETKNYGWFKEPGPTELLADHGLFFEPIIVNAKFEIIEGTTRFRRRVKLGLPIKYIQLGGVDRGDWLWCMKVSDLTFDPPFLRDKED